MEAIIGGALGLLTGYLILKWLRRLPHALREFFTIGGLVVACTGSVFMLILMLTDTSGSVLWVRVVVGTAFLLFAAWAAINVVLRGMFMARDQVLERLLEHALQTRPHLTDGE